MEAVAILQDPETREASTTALDMVQRANLLAITTDQELAAGSTLLVDLSSIKKRLENQRTFFVKPLNDQVSNINTLFKGMTTPVECAVNSLKNKIGTYNVQKESARRAALAAQQAEIAKHMEEVAAAEETGAVAPAPKAVAYVPLVDTTVRTGAGTVSQRLEWTFEVEDESKVPRLYFSLDEQRIRAAIKSGMRMIPGVKIYQRPIVAVRGR